VGDCRSKGKQGTRRNGFRSGAMIDALQGRPRRGQSLVAICRHLRPGVVVAPTGNSLCKRF